MMAIELALSDAEAPSSTHMYKVVGAHQDISSRGRVREQWYRLAMIPGTGRWQYFSDPLPRGIRAAERHATSYGYVPPGTLLAQHNRGGRVDSMYLVGDGGEVIELQFRRTVSGLEITLPDGSVIRRPDPRR